MCYLRPFAVKIAGKSTCINVVRTNMISKYVNLWHIHVFNDVHNALESYSIISCQDINSFSFNPCFIFPTSISISFLHNLRVSLYFPKLCQSSKVPLINLNNSILKKCQFPFCCCFEGICYAYLYIGMIALCLQQGVRFDPDMPQTIRLEFAKSNTKVSKPKQQLPPAAAPHPAMMHPFPGREYNSYRNDQRLTAMAILCLCVNFFWRTCKVKKKLFFDCVCKWK